MTSQYWTAEDFRDVVLYFVKASEVDLIVSFLKSREVLTSDPLWSLGVELALARVTKQVECYRLCSAWESKDWNSRPNLKRLAFQKWSELSRHALETAVSEQSAVDAARLSPEDLTKLAQETLSKFKVQTIDKELCPNELLYHRLNLCNV